MNKNLITALSIICISYFGCSKSKQPSPQVSIPTSVKIELVSGSNQTDTIGRPLILPVIVKVTQNGAPVVGYTVQFQASGCNQDNIVSTPTQLDGTAVYSWALSSEVGQQSLNAYAVNSQNRKVDSVTALATSLSTGPGWHFSACSFQDGEPLTAFCKLSTGRLFTSYWAGKNYLRYSDDNGVTWNAVKTLGNTHLIGYVMSSPSDELFVFTLGEGMFYSKDAGQTWSTLSVPPFDPRLISSAICTSSGKLLVTSGDVPLNFSIDKGKTWTTVPISAFTSPNPSSSVSGFINPAEDQAGNLYIEEQQSETIFKSIDLGKTWKALYPIERDASFYIDNNNWFYKSLSGSDGGIYISKDNGTTYNQLISSPNFDVGNISLQSDGNLYYETSHGLYSSTGISNLGNLLFVFSHTELPAYIVAKNNNVIVSGTSNGFTEYYTK